MVLFLWPVYFSAFYELAMDNLALARSRLQEANAAIFLVQGETAEQIEALDAMQVLILEIEDLISTY